MRAFAGDEARHFKRCVSVEASMLEGELLCHRLGNHMDVTGHLSEGAHDRSDSPSGLAV